MSQPTIVPALPPPPGVRSNFVNPYSLRPFNDICQAFCLSLTTIAISVRIYTNFRNARGLGADDYTACAAWVGLVAYSGTIFATVSYGAGTHAWDVPKSNLKKFAMLENANQIIYGPIIAVTKISILLLYAKLFAPRRQSKTFITIWAFICFIILFYTPLTLVKIFQCTPRAKIFDNTVPGTCINITRLIYTSGSVNLASDIALFILPIGSIWRLQLRTTQKLAISAAFTTALLAIVASAIRLGKSIKDLTVADLTYALFQIDLWTEAEIAVGIICSCLPSFPAFFRRCYPKIRNRSASGVPAAELGYASTFLNSRTLGPRNNPSVHSDAQWLNSEYLELAGSQHGPGIGRSSGGLTTIIEGGPDTRNVPRDPLAPIAGDGTRILRSVRIDTHHS